MSVPTTELKSVSNIPDFKLSTSKLEIVLLSALIVLLISVCDALAVAVSFKASLTLVAELLSKLIGI